MSIRVAYVSNLYETKPKAADPWTGCNMNTGNLIVHKAIQQTTGLPVISYENFITDNRFNDYDTIVVHLGFIQENKNSQQLSYLYEINKKYGDKVKIIPLCIGLPNCGLSLSNELAYLLKSISERCVISCMGEFTVNTLESIGIHNTTILGCPSLFYPENPDFQVSIKGLPESPKIAVNDPLFPTSKIKEEKLKEFVIFCIENNAEFIEQNFFNGVYRDCFRPEIPIPIFYDWKWGHKYFFEVQPWIEHLRNFDFVMGGCFHGSVAGLLAGAPTLMLNYEDKRFDEICRYFHIPTYPYKEFDGKLPASYFYQKMDYEKFNVEYREKFEKYICYLKANGIYNKN